jgi:hypothetical protein
MENQKRLLRVLNQKHVLGFSRNMVFVLFFSAILGCRENSTIESCLPEKEDIAICKSILIGDTRYDRYIKRGQARFEKIECKKKLLRPKFKLTLYEVQLSDVENVIVQILIFNGENGKIGCILRNVGLLSETAKHCQIAPVDCIEQNFDFGNEYDLSEMGNLIQYLFSREKYLFETDKPLANCNDLLRSFLPLIYDSLGCGVVINHDNYSREFENVYFFNPIRKDQIDSSRSAVLKNELVSEILNNKRDRDYYKTYVRVGGSLISIQLFSHNLAKHRRDVSAHWVTYY